MFSTVIHKLKHGIYIRQENKFVWVNDSLSDMLGYTKDEILQMQLTDFIYPEDRSYMKEVIKKFQLGVNEHFSFETRGMKKDGTVINMFIIHSATQFEGKYISVGSVIDISDRKKMEWELKESQQRYKTLVENLPIGILVHHEGKIDYANPHALYLLGAATQNDLVGHSVDSIVHSDYKSMVAERISTIEKFGKKTTESYQKYVRLDGEVIDLEVKGMPVQLNGIPAVQVVFWDVTEKKKEEDLIRYRAYHDTLTDLPNRHKFQLDLEEEINKDAAFTIMYLELTELKEIIDVYGHQAGDVVLMKIASRLAGTIGSNGLLYHTGGVEFSIVLQGHKMEEEIKSMAQSIQEIVSKPVYLNNTLVQITPNIGVVYYPEHGVEMDMLFRHAEMAMNNAKKSKSLYKKYDH